MKRLSKFVALPAADRWLLAQAGLLVVSIRIGLWVLPFRWLKEFIGSMGQGAAEPQGLNRDFPFKVAWTVQVSSQLVPRASCLTQALATQLMLARRGYQSNLRIGVMRDEGGKFEAHAWVESQGVVIIGGRQDLTRYVPLPSLKGHP
jgi:hypothetical protein